MLTPLFPPKLNIDQLDILAYVQDASTEVTPSGDRFSEALRSLTKAFFNHTLRRKAIFENLQRVKPLPKSVTHAEIAQLEENGLVVSVSDFPVSAVLTPLGLFALFSSREPRRRDEFLSVLVRKMQDENQSQLRSTLKTFVRAPLTLREAAAVLFLLYNDSTVPSRGRYPQSVELRRAIDRAVQAFILGRSDARETPHTDGAPGRWYIGEANRKLRNAIHIARGECFIKPDRIEYVLEVLKKTFEPESRELRRKRLSAFEDAFSRESPILARNRALFANSDSRMRVLDGLAV